MFACFVLSSQADLEFAGAITDLDKRNIALCGCGTVGSGVASLLLEEDGAAGERFGPGLRLKYILDARVEEVRADIDAPSRLVITADQSAVLQDDDVDVVVELFGGIDAAKELIEQALYAGKDVVTANKALLAEHGDELYKLARECGRSIAFEASVAGGIPIISAVRDDLVANRIQSVYGILNGTCNYVLTRMTKENLSYQEALDEAQEKGYAEADPTLDVEGLDSAHKLAVLARLAFGMNVNLDDIACEGISEVAVDDLNYARRLGYSLKLLAVGMRSQDGIDLRVHPTLLRHSHPLSAVSGAYNAVCVHGDMVGETVFTGLGAGRNPTASAVVADIYRVALGTYGQTFRTLNRFGELPDAAMVPFEDVMTRYYFRLGCLDRPGVLAQVAGIMGEEDISISSCIQQDLPAEGEEHVPVVFMTHKAREGDVQQALRRINKLECIDGSRTHMLRVQDI